MNADFIFTLRKIVPSVLGLMCFPLSFGINSQQNSNEWMFKWILKLINVTDIKTEMKTFPYDNYFSSFYHLSFCHSGQ